MSLEKVLRKKRLTVLGLNSGTSADGLDLALVRVSSEGRRRVIRFIGGAKKPYPSRLRSSIIGMADSKTTPLDELLYLDNVLGRFYGKAASAFIESMGSSVRVDLIASHGQTVRHLPDKVRRLGQKVAGSMQLGSPDFISSATGLPVVSDFRQADIALGHEGAPITVSAMRDLFASSEESRLIVNIGGMSNYFYFPRRGSDMPVRASDCGPGNSLCDVLSAQLNGERYDVNGRRAQRGKVSERLVRAVMAGPIFRASTVSTGRESFGPAAAGRLKRLADGLGLSGDDVMASAAELTVQSIIRSLRPLLNRDKLLSKLYLTGGGRYNIFFVDGLKRNFPRLEILMIDTLGINGDLVEASAYAVMGEWCLRSRSMQTRFVGRRPQTLLPVPGKITQPPTGLPEI